MRDDEMRAVLEWERVEVGAVESEDEEGAGGGASLDGDGNTAWKLRVLEEIRPRLRRMLSRHVGDSHVVDDLVQETVMRALRFHTALRTRPAFEGWLARIAYNLSMDWHRSVRRQADRHPACAAYEETHSPLLHAPSDHQRDVADEWARWRRSTWESLARLPARDCALVLAYYFVGLPCAEVAHRSGLTVSNVKVRLHRARAMMRRQLPPEREFRRFQWARSHYAPREGLVMRAGRVAS